MSFQTYETLHHIPLSITSKIWQCFYQAFVHQCDHSTSYSAHFGWRPAFLTHFQDLWEQFLATQRQSSCLRHVMLRRYTRASNGTTIVLVWSPDSMIESQMIDILAAFPISTSFQTRQGRRRILDPCRKFSSNDHIAVQPHVSGIERSDKTLTWTVYLARCCPNT